MGVFCQIFVVFVPTNGMLLRVAIGRDPPRWQLIMASFFTSLLRDYRRPWMGAGFLSRNRYLLPSCKGQKVGPSFQGQHFYLSADFLGLRRSAFLYTLIWLVS